MANIEDSIASIQSTVDAMPQAITAAVVTALNPSATPAQIAAAVVSALPATDFSGVLSAIADARTALASGEGVTQAHLNLIDTEVQTVQKTLGPPAV